MNKYNHPALKFIKTKIHGITLMEFLSAFVILVVVLTVTLGGYMLSLQLSELSKNYSIATNAVKSRMEEIKNTPFNNILANNNTTFTYNNLNGWGFVYVQIPVITNPNLLQVTVSFCWKNQNGRMIGEDKNNNGIKDAGEDVNGNGMIDSPVKFSTFIYKLK